ncbi:hypothetical protein F53441_2701 [Fusarium austroafricanum]|uniref:Acyltransferase 3 domain-containing protein n=1 Tax=Fusarium austroafricanum TaxID=2364996 RepID=A0A8H4P3M1_9HYPO|nr:hypothetical protein F53441_2701 [Fusarium austroafricanum]
MTVKQERNLQWVEGLRGIASTLVWITHLTRAVDYDLYSPSSGEGLRPRLLQLPFLRILIQGRMGVIIFIYVTGYVCALKPLALFRQGDFEAGWASISKTALRRLPRLMYPSVIATAIAWTAAQLGLFEVARQTDSYYLTETAQPSLPIVSAVRSLFVNIFNTWTGDGNKYDVHQGTLFVLFKGAAFVLVFLSATAKVKSHFRMGAALGLWGYYWYCADPYFMQFWWGVLMNDLHNSQLLRVSRAKSRYLPAIASSMMVIGLFIASYPEGHHERTHWSYWQDRALSKILPKDSEFPKFASALGFDLITLGGALMPEHKILLSHPILLWLGRHSFAVYLLHGTLLRWLLTWMMYGAAQTSDTQLERRDGLTQFTYQGHFRLLFCLPIWLVVLYGCAALWTRYIDMLAQRFTARLTTYIMREDNKNLDLV